MSCSRKTMTIDSAGNVYPCSFFTPFSEFKAGNAKENGFMRIWRDSEVFKRFRLRKTTEECANCKHYEKNCLGGCPAIPYAVYGNVEKLDPTCPKEEMEKH